MTVGALGLAAESVAVTVAVVVEFRNGLLETLSETEGISTEVVGSAPTARP